MISPTVATSIARKLPTPLYKMAAQAWVDYKFPRHIFIETTANCQLRCEYCPREQRQENMDYELFKQIVEEASHYGPRSFSLHLFGEPLLYPHILSAISFIKAKNKRNTVLLTTNGVLLNRYVEDLLRCGVDKIIWSWRKNNFNERTRQVLKEKGKIRFLLEETPEGEIEKWKDAKDVEIKHLHNYGGNIDVKKWGVTEGVVPERYPCYHLWLAPAVRWNGEITFCCNVPQLGYEVMGTYPNDSISSVWKGSRLEEIREEHKKKVYKGACANCTSWQAYPSIF